MVDGIIKKGAAVDITRSLTLGLQERLLAVNNKMYWEVLGKYSRKYWTSWLKVVMHNGRIIFIHIIYML